MSRIIPAQEFYRPNSDSEIFSDTGTSDPMTHQRPWTHENDAIVRLRRAPQPLSNVGRLWQKTRPHLRVAPLELEVAQPLPDVCAPHGRPATGTATVRTLFFDTDAHPRFPNRRGLHEYLRKGWRTEAGIAAPVSTIVGGEWPICPRCARRARTYRRIAIGILVFIVIEFAAFLTVSFAGIDWLKPWLGYAFCPGSILGSILALTLFDKSVEPVAFRPIYDERFAFVPAHPRFRQALQGDFQP
ncbi:hypothetical protein [Nocardia carnea]|uniref:hypothetical protein n=1 Tax=Nocardia carnea TaxID=37328 RepID=UPI002455EDCD|nr:hypothetical protein [Nocardia carnea]